MLSETTCAEYRVLGTECGVQSTEHRILSTELCETTCADYRMLVTEYRLLSTAYRVPGAEY